ncbi:glycosyl transferase [Pseudooceanicola sp. LIPI14-2-Ac024]|uniref:glycosyl transferase n=1 Tax=Pseudooceanicola sp. LIPI14-2-Ac024 TaxID=3344875 RepID=UPI0035CF5926
MTDPHMHCLQALLWPEPGLCTERDLYLRLRQGAAMSLDAREVLFPAGALASSLTYSNLFNIGAWRVHCGLDDVALTLEGEGRFELSILLARPDRSTERVLNTAIRLTPGADQTWPVPLDAMTTPHGVLYFELRAMSADGILRAARWETEEPPRRTPDLMLSITTFRREAAVMRTVARFRDFIARTPLADHLHLTVVDNGQTLDLPAADSVTVLPNANLGGSGGFARGLIEARRRGASHCLFMDDDAAVHMEAVERTWTFLAYAKDPATAVSGALAHARMKWTMWENGAEFYRLCHPQFGQTDLRRPSIVLKSAYAASTPKPANFYGGWWFFAFPVDAVRHDPFPFFVRGDDISFGLMNDFRPTTLPGVICHQDEDFYLKESPQTLYLDLRGHLAHHMVAPQLEISRRSLMTIVAWFYLRSLLSSHYETIEALTLSLQDFIAGPRYFEDNPDVASRRAQIKALMHDEVWTEGAPPLTVRRRLDPDNFLARLLMKLTLNGYLLPFFRRIGDDVVLPARKRGRRRLLWGAARITYVDEDNGRHYTVTHSKRRAWTVSRAYFAQVLRLWRNHDRIRDDWRQGYARLTTPASWDRLLNLPGAEAANAAPAPSADPVSPS